MNVDVEDVGDNLKQGCEDERGTSWGKTSKPGKNVQGAAWKRQ